MAENKQAKKTSIKKEETEKDEKVTSQKGSAIVSNEKLKKEEKKIESKDSAVKKEVQADNAEEATGLVQELKMDESLVRKTASKDTSGKFVQKKKKRKIRRQIHKGQAYVKATYNNTIVTLADLHGNILAWSSAGYLGFKGAKKATTYAAAQVVLDVTEKVQKYGLKEIDVYVKGVGSGRESAIRTLAQKGFNLNLIKDRTPIPHNGCRPKKPRRV
jgi:small subunit ribosomal protein S11